MGTKRGHMGGGGGGAYYNEILIMVCKISLHLDNRTRNKMIRYLFLAIAFDKQCLWSILPHMIIIVFHEKLLTI